MWFRKAINKRGQLIGDDPAVEILTMLATGTKDVDTAFQELTSNNIPIPYTCELINSLLQSGPRYTSALYALSNKIGCLNQSGIAPSQPREIPAEENIETEQNTGIEFGA